MKWSNILLALLFFTSANSSCFAQVWAIPVPAKHRAKYSSAMSVQFSPEEFEDMKFFFGDKDSNSVLRFLPTEDLPADTEGFRFEALVPTTPDKQATLILFARELKAEWFGIHFGGQPYYSPPRVTRATRLAPGANGQWGPLRGLHLQRL